MYNELSHTIDCYKAEMCLGNFTLADEYKKRIAELKLLKSDKSQ